MQPKNPDYEKRVRENFALQTALSSIGAEMVKVLPGATEIHLRYRDSLTQQHGYVHGGVIATIADTACGYSAMSLVSAGSEVLTVEFKINFVNPARGDLFIARGRVKKAGRTLTICEGEVLSGETTIAVMLATVMTVSAGLTGKVAAPK
jgi:uncharacterized protein (TIGR00369 family)